MRTTYAQLPFLPVVERFFEENFWGDVAISPRLAGKMLTEFHRLSQANGGEVVEEFSDLTQREVQVLSLVAQGRLDKEIGERLSISIFTVKSHLRSILAKLQVSNRRQAAREAKRSGLV